MGQMRKLTWEVCEELKVTRHQLQVMLPLIGVFPKKVKHEGRWHNVFGEAELKRLREVISNGHIKGPRSKRA